MLYPTLVRLLLHLMLFFVMGNTVSSGISKESISIISITDLTLCDVDVIYSSLLKENSLRTNAEKVLCKVAPYIRVGDQYIPVAATLRNTNSFVSSDYFLVLHDLVSKNLASENQLLFYLLVIMRSQSILSNKPEIATSIGLIEADSSQIISNEQVKIRLRNRYEDIVYQYISNMYALNISEYSPLYQMLINEFVLISSLERSRFLVDIFFSTKRELVPEFWFRNNTLDLSNLFKMKDRLIKIILDIKDLEAKKNIKCSNYIYNANCYINLIVNYEASEKIASYDYVANVKNAPLSCLIRQDERLYHKFIAQISEDKRDSNSP